MTIGSDVSRRPMRGLTALIEGLVLFRVARSAPMQWPFDGAGNGPQMPSIRGARSGRPAGHRRRAPDTGLRARTRARHRLNRVWWGN